MGNIAQTDQAKSVRDAESKEVEISAELLPESENRRKHFMMPRESTLLEVIAKSAQELDVHLLPTADKPLDRLHGIYRDHEVGESLNLTITLDQFLEGERGTHLFGVELVRAIRVNTRWLIAPEDKMTPKGILTLAGLSWEQYSLYSPPDSLQPLPPDTNIYVARGQLFEAQRDGKYGSGVCSADRKG